MRVSGLAAAAALAGIVAGGTATAEEWTVAGTDGVSATVCAEEQDDTCLALGCTAAGAPLTLSLSYNGADPSAPLGVSVRVDGGLAGAADLQTTDAPGQWSVPVTADHGRLLSQLAAGTRATLDLRRSDTELTLPLSGAGPAIAEALAVCARPEGFAVANPEALERAAIEAACRRAGDTPVFGQGFVRRADLNDDGIGDIHLNLGQGYCEEMRTLNCGTAGCAQAFWSGTSEGTFLPAWSGYFLGYTTLPDGDLVIDLHGSECDDIGAAPCRKVYRWISGRLVSISG
ncbi:hypothetical protein DXV76_15770 [Rhodobacteraceae bacterium CCMM004]|nr:hypothetical protein DXV76_15770 [Rhodobacteraceae bacterium CCMM004]